MRRIVCPIDRTHKRKESERVRGLHEGWKPAYARERKHAVQRDRKCVCKGEENLKL